MPSFGPRKPCDATKTSKSRDLEVKFFVTQEFGSHERPYYWGGRK